MTTEATQGGRPVYLQLFHGRRDPAEVLEDWGTEGPAFGPLDYVHTTYGGHIKMQYAGRDTETYVDLYVAGDLLYYGGVYYGDWSVCSTAPDVVEEYDAEKARLPEAAPAPAAGITVEVIRETAGGLTNDVHVCLSEAGAAEKVISLMEKGDSGNPLIGFEDVDPAAYPDRVAYARALLEAHKDAIEGSSYDGTELYWETATLEA